MSFTRYGRLYYLDPGEHTYKVGDKVLVPTDSGPEVAECVWAPQYTSEDVEGLPVCAGPAGEEHLSRDESNKRRRAEARSVSKRLIKRHSLPMKVVGIDYLDEDNVYTVYFSAPHRVDFRALVRDLARNLRARVELRQIGPPATRPASRAASAPAAATCAARPSSRTSSRSPYAWPRTRTSRSTRCASRGACGRLMCCLKYEHPLYQEFRASAPRTGTSVETPRGARNGGGPQRAVRLRGGAAQRRGPAVLVLPGQRVRAQEGVRLYVRGAAGTARHRGGGDAGHTL
ncbi:PSP1 domain-containing protein [Nonomuraea salmonea]|uniref:PSP1 domain-containing protein n=1 Tax=Nonomuraea salmonea TaxID=46181 RepID=UPI0031E6F49B